jgi:hypothetical protein
MFDFHDHHSLPFFWLAIVAIVFITAFARSWERSSRYRAIERMAEKGQTVPPEMLRGRHLDRGYYGSSVWHGIYLMCIGVALFVFFWAMTGGGNYFNGEGMPNWLPFVGIFPFMIGVARLLAAIFDRPRQN